MFGVFNIFNHHKPSTNLHALGQAVQVPLYPIHLHALGQHVQVPLYPIHLHALGRAVQLRSNLSNFIKTACNLIQPFLPRAILPPRLQSFVGLLLLLLECVCLFLECSPVTDVIQVSLGERWWEWECCSPVTDVMGMGIHLIARAPLIS